MFATTSVQPQLAQAPTLTQIVAIFQKSFAHENVILKGGFDEPFYQSPRLQNEVWKSSEIRFRQDYLNSCLHEIAHWCLAGDVRRTQNDYGYWYSPDGRNAEQQLAFFKAEAGPQALEWIFAVACNVHFRPSCDNLSGEAQSDSNGMVVGVDEFEKALKEKLKQFMEKKIPPRAKIFFEKLMAQFHPEISSSERLKWLWSRLGLSEKSTAKQNILLNNWELD